MQTRPNPVEQGIATVPRDVDGLRDWLVQQVAALRGLETGAVSLTEPFLNLGIDSMIAMKVVNGLSQLLGRPLAPTLLWEHPTVDALARHLVGADPARAPSVAARAQPAANEAEPIALVGLACRFPKAPDARAFWQVLQQGMDCVTRVPGDRWDADLYYDPTPGVAGKIVTREGAFLDSVDRFDPHFFAISPREAGQLDPQQRLLLELAWKALEDAGLPPRSLVLALGLLIIFLQRFAFGLISVGMIEASATRRPWTPRTRRRGSTMAASSAPMRAVPTG